MADQAEQNKADVPVIAPPVEENELSNDPSPKFNTPGPENSPHNTNNNIHEKPHSDPQHSVSNLPKPLQSPVPTVPKITEAKGSVQSLRSEDFPYPPPYPVRYMSSAGFSDITLPGLASTQSFGTHPGGGGGYMVPPPFDPSASAEYHLPPGTFYYFPHPPPLPPPPHNTHPTHPSASFHPPHAIHPHYESHVQTTTQVSSSSNPNGKTDLDVAARALLDLTPAFSVPAAAAERSKENTNHPSQHKRKMDLLSNDDDDEGAVQPPPPAARVQFFQQQQAPPHTSHAYRALTVSSRAQRLLENVPYTTLACKCKNSKCLKLYCSCFQTGSLCDARLCKCDDCSNTFEQSTSGGARMNAVFATLRRRPDAFEPRLRKKTGGGCFCKKTRCLRKYCDCFANKQVCSIKCGCDDCHNTPSGEPAINLPLPTTGSENQQGPPEFVASVASSSSSMYDNHPSSI